MGWTLLYAGVVLLGLFLGFAGAGALLFSWSLVPRTYSLESRVSELEQDLIHEVKKRAGQERWSKPKAEDDILAEIGERTAKPAGAGVWYEKFVHPDLKR